MARERVEWMREGLEALNRGDRETVEVLLRDRLASAFEAHPLYLGQVYKGAEGVQAMLADIRETWEDYRLVADEIIDLGEQVLVLARVRGRGAASGVPVDQPVAVLLTFEGEQVVRSKAFTSRGGPRSRAAG